MKSSPSKAARAIAFDSEFLNTHSTLKNKDPTRKKLTNYPTITLSNQPRPKTTMRKIRIYTPQPLEKDTEIPLDARAKKHLIQVLRKRTGDAVTLFNGNGQDAHGVIVKADARAECVVRVDALEAVSTESPLAITLVQAIAKGDRMDWVVQKSVELGVAEIRPVWTERTEVRLDDQRAEKRQQRWQDIAIHACEQSGRAVVPTVHSPASLTQGLASVETPGIFLHPEAKQCLHGVAETLDEASPRMVVAIGPEGGFAADEIDELEAKGYRAIRIGPRVLRTETAGPAVLAALQALSGDWRG